MLTNSTVRDHYAAGIFSYTRWRADVFRHLDAAIEADEGLVLPRLVKAWALQGARDTAFTCQLQSQ